jgi:hypothetical protein
VAEVTTIYRCEAENDGLSPAYRGADMTLLWERIDELLGSSHMLLPSSSGSSIEWSIQRERGFRE